MINYITCKRKYFLAALAALTALVASRSVFAIDLALIKLIQSAPLEVFDRLSLFFTILGSGEVTGVITAALAAWLYLKNHKKAAFYLLLFFGLSVAVELSMKFSVEQPKVFAQFRRGLKIPVPIYSPFTPYAYPSGHATRSVILSLVFFYMAQLKITSEKIKARAKTFIVFVCALMLISRVYEGSHWPMDVIGGICLGSYLAALIIERFQKDNF